MEHPRQGRDCHLGNAGARLSAAGGHAALRAARMSARHFLQLVSLQPAARQIPVHSRRADRPLAQGSRRSCGPGRCLDEPRRKPGDASPLATGAWQRRLAARRLGHGAGNHRCLDGAHDQEARSRSNCRLLADPGHVDDQLCFRRAADATDRRHLALLLRLVLRLADGVAGDVGRTDRRAGKRRLVSRQDAGIDGCQHRHDADTGLPLPGRRTPQRDQAVGLFAGLQPGRQVRGRVGRGQHRPGWSVVDGRESRAADRVSSSEKDGLLPQLHAQVHRRPVSGGTQGERSGCAAAGPIAPRRAAGQVRRRGTRRVEVPDVGRRGQQPQNADGQQRLSLGQTTRPLESAAQGRQGRQRHSSATQLSG